MIEKFQIFYQPSKTKRKGIESFSLSYYDFEPDMSECKEKIVLEKNGKKYKIKRQFEKLDTLLPVLNNFDLNKYKVDKVNYDDATYCIQYNNDNISTNINKKLEELLSQLKFDDLFVQVLTTGNEVA
jgi:hypothetical protein